MSRWCLNNLDANSSSNVLEQVEIQNLISSGLITISDEIRKEGDKNWQSLADLEEFREFFPPEITIKNDDDENIDMNALIDVCLVLLVFFILLTSYSKLIQHLEAAKTNTDSKIQTLTESQAEKKTKVVIKSKDGKTIFLINDQIVETNDLINSLKISAKKLNNRDLILYYSDEVSYQSVITIQDAARAADFQQILQALDK
jgi:biopolymer transport protein ExbD